MLNRIRNILILLRRQMWLIPALISVLTSALALSLLKYGHILFEPAGSDLWWIFGGDASSARDLMSSLLSGLISMTALVISITFVALTLAAAQLGPRLIAMFMADRQIQTVFGLFLGTILYLLFVLRTIKDELGQDAVPHVAITVGSALTVLCLFTLLFYLDKVARSIIADNVINATANDLHRHIRSILPEQGEATQDNLPPPDLRGGVPASLGRSGYIQTIDYDALVKLARRVDVVFRIELKAGKFVLKHGHYVRAHRTHALGEDAVKDLRQAFVIGQTRTPAQDLEYNIRQLVEIAIRALSPGINDPFTAVAALNRLGGALEDILSREPLPRFLRDEEGEVRVVADRLNAGAIDAAFDLIRQTGAGKPLILSRIADLLGQLAPVIHHAEAQRAALAQLDKLSETAREAPLSPSGHDNVMKRIDDARAAIEQRSGSGLDEP
jgi:uncharacterized membrane protein